MAKANLKPVNNIDDEDDAEELTPEEIAAELREKLSRDHIVKLFNLIEDCDSKIADLKEKKRAAFTKLTELGADKKGLQMAHKRNRADSAKQARIDATFKVVCEILSGQDDLFGYRPKEK